MASSEVAVVHTALGLLNKASAAQQLQGAKQLLTVASTCSDKNPAMQMVKDNASILDRLLHLATCAVAPRSPVVAKTALSCVTKLYLAHWLIKPLVVNAITPDHQQTMVALARAITTTLIQQGEAGALSTHVDAQSSATTAGFIEHFRQNDRHLITLVAEQPSSARGSRHGQVQRHEPMSEYNLSSIGSIIALVQVHLPRTAMLTVPQPADRCKQPAQHRSVQATTP